MGYSRPDDLRGLCQTRTLLLAADRQNSVLAELASDKANAIAYTAFGCHSAQHKIAAGIGFNGELLDSCKGWYFLGNGYRVYNPRLMRFHCPDSSSPFSKGGLNAYAYCLGDPVNQNDPSGHFSIPISIANKMLSWVHRARSNLGLKTKRSALGISYVSNDSSAVQRTSPSKYYPAGFHGTSSEHSPSLERGLNSNFSGKETGQSHGSGFYATTDIEYARRMAKLTTNTDYTPEIYTVFVKDYPQQPHTTQNEPLVKMSHYDDTILIPTGLYRNTLVRRLGKTTLPPKLYNIRQK